MSSKDQAREAYNVLRAQDGVQAGLECLYRDWNAKFIAYVSRMLRNPDPANDIVQDGWIAVARKIHTLDDPRRFRPWGYRIMTNKALDWMRKVAREDRLKKDVEIENSVREFSSTVNDDGEILIALIAKLPEKKRMLLRLFYVEDFLVEDLAVFFETNAGTIKSRLFHARESLKKEFEIHKKEISNE